MSQLLHHFGFEFHPFGRKTPKDALFHHPGYEEALSRLRFSVDIEEPAILLADSGLGKSLLLGHLSDTLCHDGWGVYYFAHASTGPCGLVSVLARNMGITPKRTTSETAALLAQALLKNGAPHLICIDEAHELPDKTLADIRLLTISDFDRKMPFLLLLSGQPALDDRLAEPTHHALDQRITTVARLLPLSADETRDYINRRLRAALIKKSQPVFDDSAVDAIFEATSGVPRRINALATSAMIVAAARKRRLVAAQDVQDARLDRGRA
jgi:type II secretory pathway predicted ATPase ExeA